MSTSKKGTQKPQRVTTPAPELPQQPEPDEDQQPDLLTSRLAALVNPLERIALAMERTAVAQSQVRDLHLERANREEAERQAHLAQEQQDEIDALTDGHLPGSTIEPMRGD